MCLDHKIYSTFTLCLEINFQAEAENSILVQAQSGVSVKEKGKYFI